MVHIPSFANIYKFSTTRYGSTNLVTNPGFEDAAGWSEWRTSYYPGTSFLRATSGTAAPPPQSGQYAYAISNHSKGNLQSDSVSVTPNSTYDLYAFIRGELDPDDSHGTWQLRINYYDSAGTYLTYQDAVSGNPGGLTAAWLYLGGQITTPANAASLKVRLYLYQTSGWIAFDDISLTKVSDYQTTTLSYSASVSCPGGNRTIPHAASAFGGSTYSYDCNGNMSGRTVSGAASTLTYNAENRLTGIAGANTASFIYDGDGNRVKSVVGGATMVTIGDYFEWTGSASTVKSYYYAGGARVAVRTGSSLNWILTDHLGSTSVVTDANGTLHSKQLYKPWGETRSTSGTLPTDYKYTGQRETVLGLYDYKARFYDPALGRFIQADSIVPGAGNPSAWDRYAYTLNNPVRYTDPSGHDVGLWDW